MNVSVARLAQDVDTLKTDIKVIPASCKDGTGLGELAAELVAI
jgi:hypothetical protein